MSFQNKIIKKGDIYLTNDKKNKLTLCRVITVLKNNKFKIHYLLYSKKLDVIVDGSELIDSYYFLVNQRVDYKGIDDEAKNGFIIKKISDEKYKVVINKITLEVNISRLYPLGYLTYKKHKDYKYIEKHYDNKFNKKKEIKKSLKYYSESDRLKNKITLCYQNGFELKFIEPDNHCFYRCLSRSVLESKNSDEETKSIKMLRKTIADNIENSSKEKLKMKAESLNQTSDQYLKGIRENAWAGDYIIEIAQKLFDVNINPIEFKDDSLVICEGITDNKKSMTDMHVLYVNNSHFELLIPINKSNCKSLEDIIKDFINDEEEYKKKKEQLEFESLKELLDGKNDKDILDIFCDQIIGNLDY